MSYFERTQVETSDSASVDAFQRWRVSTPVTLLDGCGCANNARFWSNELISGTMTSTENLARNSTTFTSTANTAGRRVRATYKRFNSTPGKSIFVLCSFVMGAASGGNTKRVGYFDDRNGVFLKQDGSEVSLNRRTYTSGSAVDNKVLQADWNLDPMDGTGPSGETIDLTKVQGMVIDLEGGAGGRVRIGWNIDGHTHYCHKFLASNVLDVAYVTTASLVVRSEMEHSGTGPASTFEFVGATVISEGGSRPVGAPSGFSSGSVSGLNAGTGYVLQALKLDTAGVYGPVIKLAALEVAGTTNNDSFLWYLLRDPTVTGTLTYAAYGSSPIQHATGNNTQTVTVVDDEVLAVGVGISQALVEFDAQDDVQLEVASDNTPIPLILAIFPLSNMTAASALRWRTFA